MVLARLGPRSHYVPSFALGIGGAIVPTPICLWHSRLWFYHVLCGHSVCEGSGWMLLWVLWTEVCYMVCLQLQGPGIDFLPCLFKSHISVNLKHRGRGP